MSGQRGQVGLLARFGWFVLLWCAGVTAIAVVAGLLRLVLQ